jgi:iron complex transport system substrate-binding protein
MKIVSLLPSATEIVCALGLADSLVGVTHECDYPPGVLALPKVTQTLIPHDATSGEIDALVRERLTHQRALYTLNMKELERLRPDVIVTQALCDVCAVAEEEVMNAACSLPGSPVVINLEPMSLEDVLETLSLVGEATDKVKEAASAVSNLRSRVEAVKERTSRISVANKPRVAFLEWIDPPFNGGHWNPTLVQMAGGVDLLGASGQPSRTIRWEDVTASQPDVLFVACCGFPVQRALEDLPSLMQQPGWEDLDCVRTGHVYFTDGNAYFSRPGPRLVDSLEIMANALHPHHHPLPTGLPPAFRVLPAVEAVHR